MTRDTTNISVGGGKVRARVRISGDSCERGTLGARMEQFRLLRALGDAPDLTSCAMAPFEYFHMFHDGARWVIECEAIVDDPQGLLNARPPTSPT